MDIEFLQRLRCMHTGSPLSLATDGLVRAVNFSIESKQLRDHLGRPIEQRIERALINDQGSVLYPIVNGTVQMLADETIDLTNFEQPKEL